MKTLTLLSLALLLNLAFAHEGGHGELNEAGKFGGITAPIVLNSEAANASKAKMLFKAELVRSESGKLSFYVLDEKMNVVDLKIFDDSVVGKLEMKKKGKFTYFGEVKLTKDGNHFTGQLPKIDYKPFNIDFFLGQNKQKLFVGFSNLD